MEKKLFEKGKTYYAIVRTTGERRFFTVTNVYRSKSTGKRVLVEGSYNCKPAARYEIRTSGNGTEWIDVDQRLCLVVTADEWKGGTK